MAAQETVSGPRVDDMLDIRSREFQDAATQDLEPRLHYGGV